LASGALSAFARLVSIADQPHGRYSSRNDWSAIAAGWSVGGPAPKASLYDVGMHRNNLRSLTDVVLFLTALLTFGSGLVLFFEFHVGSGTFRLAALGLTRLTWLNLHRLVAMGLLAALGLHLALNGRALLAQLERVISRRRGSPAVSEILLYTTFSVVVVTGLVAWFAIDGSPPLAGPIALGPQPSARHHVIDVHNVVGLVTLLLTVHHIGHRWRRMIRGLETAWARRDARRPLPPEIAEQ
jgi:hypothetical protein